MIEFYSKIVILSKKRVSILVKIFKNDEILLARTDVFTINKKFHIINSVINNQYNYSKK
jgi:hypothetical protein